MSRFLLGLFTALSVFPAVGLTPAMAQPSDRPAVEVIEPWARASAGMAKTGAVYMTLTAKTGSDRLVAASTPVAGRAELHTTIKDGDIARMRRLDAIDVKPGTPVLLGPGGHHVMLMDLKARLKEGETFSLTLTFEKAGPVTVQATVRGPGAMGHGH